MKIIAFNGSPAGRESNTNVIVEAFLRGAKQADAETENVFLVEKQINYCKGCFTCWFKTPGRCVMEDDMEELLQKYLNADVVCFATPVYTWNMTANMKTFVDRLAPLKSPLIIQQNGSFDLTDAKAKLQKFIVISNCGFPGENNFETMRNVMAPCDPCLEIYRNCGKLLKSKDEKIRKKVDEYLKVVEQSGLELADAGAVCEETKRELNMEIMSVSDYIKYIGM